MLRKSWIVAPILMFLSACAQTDGPPVVPKPVAVAAETGPAGEAKSTDHPLFGGTPQRNMVNLTAKNVPTSWTIDEDPKKCKNVKWVAQLGSKSYGGPVIAGGKIYMGTNNAHQADAKIKKAVLMAFNEADGKYLWHISHESPADGYFNEGRTSGLCSTPVVEGNRLFYVTPACEVICADTNGKVQWTYDMMKELAVIPHHLAACSPLVVGDLVMVVSGNGIDDEGKIPSPKAPSFVAVNKKTGKLAWQSNLPGKDIMEGQWSNPALAEVNGKKQVIFPGGDCVLYSFEPETGKLIWKCNCNPTRKKGEIDNQIIATPVVVGDRVYVSLGLYPENAASTRSSHALCVDITKTGDVSPKTLNAKDAVNKGSALVWAFGGMIDPAPAKGRQAYFGRTLSTAAVHDGLLYIPEEIGYIHCLDAKTGQRYWEHDFKENVLGSAYYVDGKVYVGTVDGDMVIFEHGKTKKIIAKVGMEESVESTPVVANGVLYINTRSKLYAIANGK